MIFILDLRKLAEKGKKPQLKPYSASVVDAGTEMSSVLLLLYCNALKLQSWIKATLC